MKLKSIQIFLIQTWKIQERMYTNQYKFFEYLGVYLKQNWRHHAFHLHVEKL